MRSCSLIIAITATIILLPNSYGRGLDQKEKSACDVWKSVMTDIHNNGCKIIDLKNFKPDPTSIPQRYLREFEAIVDATQLGINSKPERLKTPVPRKVMLKQQHFQCPKVEAEVLKLAKASKSLMDNSAINNIDRSTKSFLPTVLIGDNLYDSKCSSIADSLGNDSALTGMKKLRASLSPEDQNFSDKLQREMQTSADLLAKIDSLLDTINTKHDATLEGTKKAEALFYKYPEHQGVQKYLECRSLGVRVFSPKDGLPNVFAKFQQELTKLQFFVKTHHDKLARVTEQYYTHTKNLAKQGTLPARCKK